MRNQLAIGIIILILCLGWGPKVQADEVSFSMIGRQGNVHIGERASLPSGEKGGYRVDILNDTTSVFGFAVSSNNVPDPGDAEATRQGWNAVVLTQKEWDMGHQIGMGTGGFLTSDIGSFSALFGDDPGVNIHYNVFGQNLTDSDDNDNHRLVCCWTGQFQGRNRVSTRPGKHLSDLFGPEYFGSSSISEFVAFSSQGDIIDQSRQLQNQAIPEPSTMLLLGTGLAGLVAWRWKAGKNN